MDWSWWPYRMASKATRILVMVFVKAAFHLFTTPNGTETLKIPII